MQRFIVRGAFLQKHPRVDSNIADENQGFKLWPHLIEKERDLKCVFSSKNLNLCQSLNSNFKEVLWRSQVGSVVSDMSLPFTSVVPGSIPGRSLACGLGVFTWWLRGLSLGVFPPLSKIKVCVIFPIGCFADFNSEWEVQATSESNEHCLRFRH